MTDQKVHIIITGEAGKGLAFALRKKTLRTTVIGSLILTVMLAAGSLAGVTLYQKNRDLASRTETLDLELAQTSTVLAKIKVERDRLVARYEENISQLEHDRDNLLEHSISRLDERSKVIQEIMDNIGVDLKIEEDPDHSGGPFLDPDQEYGERLIYQTDHYLEVLRTIPLGRPVPGMISSKYGRRTDPLVQKKAFHPGIDFRGNTGDEIKATANAVVKQVGRNNVLGRYIILGHGNGFETIFAHMHKTLVKKGEKIVRGQVIGQIGNTGRSTGSHLHYGIRYNGNSVDPMKYLQVADLSLTVNS